MTELTTAIATPGPGWPVIDPQDDLPHTPPDTPLWSESYFFFAYDDAASVGVLIHMSITPFDSSLWRGVMAVYLPGDELLVAKAYGRDGTPDGPGAGPLRITCEKPLHTWRISFDGAAQRVTRSQLAHGPLVDGRAEPLHIDLRFDATAPIYDLRHDMAKQSFGAAHHQQAGHVTGTIRTTNLDVPLAAYSYRDHGYGPRDLTPVLGDAWNNARFPDGRLFCSIDFRSINESAHIMRGYTERDGNFQSVTPIQTPPLDGPGATPERFELKLQDGDEMLTIKAEVLHCFTFTFAPPNDVLIGSDTANPDHLHVCEAPTRYELDGQVTVGLCERIARIRNLR